MGVQDAEVRAVLAMTITGGRVVHKGKGGVGKPLSDKWLGVQETYRVSPLAYRFPAT
jgi:hypothetical protein